MPNSLISLVFNNIFDGATPAIVAGPCSAESEEQVLRSAQELIEVGVKVLRAGVWKPRTIPGGFEGFGEEALKWMVAAREKTGILIGTEIGTASQARLALDYNLDFVWLGARTTTSPFVVDEIGSVLKSSRIPIFVKNPIAPDLSLWHGAILRLQKYDIQHIIPILRGFRLGNRGDLRNSPLWYLTQEFRKLHPTLPFFCDPSHIAGRTDLLPEVVREASLQGYDGLFIEVHPDPKVAYTDALQQIKPSELSTLLHSWQSFGNGNTPLYDFRQQLSVIDDEIIRLLAEREATSTQIGRWKLENGIEFLQKEQKEKMEEHRRTFARQHGANPDLVSKLFDLIHDDSVEIQNQTTSLLSKHSQQ